MGSGIIESWRESGREEKLALLLRIGVAGCFIGHGAFGVMGKEAWLPYFAVAGIGPDLAWTLMPLVGWIDILIGVAVLIRPRPVLLGYAALWAVWTALLRPLAGESVFETFERAGNYGVPLALLALATLRRREWRWWLRPLEPARLGADRMWSVETVLRATTALLLVGHGGLALSGKELLVDHAAALGLPADAVLVAGGIEVALGLAVAVRPFPALLLFVLAWKVSTEALYPLTGAPFWEFVERAGSYVAPLALWTLVRRPLTTPRLVSTAAARGAGVLIALLATGLAGAVDASARPSPADPPTDTALLERLRAGGYVLACRHALTDRRRGDRRPVDLADPSTQRVLSEAGRLQARRFGATLRRLEIPVGEVWASPYARTRDSARLAFGTVRTDPSLYWYGGSSGKRSAVRRLLTSPPEGGTNRAIMTHQGVLYGTIPSLERGSLDEGDCVVIAPRGGEFEVLARMAADDWEELGDGVEAARAGGVTLLCRHQKTGSTREREPVDYDDPSTQRRLSREGERRSRRVGRALRALRVDVVEVVASPMQRALRTARLMMDRPVRIDSVWHTNGGSYGGLPRERRAAVLATPVARRGAAGAGGGSGGDDTGRPGVRLIVSHIGTMSSVVPEARGRVGEGDCAVVRPRSGGHELVAIVPWERWIEAAGPAGGRWPQLPQRPVSAQK